MSNNKVGLHLDLPFKEFMPGQIIKSQEFNDDMIETEDKVNEIIDKYNNTVDDLSNHVSNKENPHEVNPHQIGTYESSEIDEFINDLKDGNFNDRVITNRVMGDESVDNRTLVNGSVTVAKTDPQLGNQLDIESNISITNRYTKDETDKIIQDKVGDGTYTKGEIDKKFEDVQAGQIVDGTIGTEKFKETVGELLDISKNPNITNRYTKDEVNVLLSNVHMPRDWGGLTQENFGAIVDTCVVDEVVVGEEVFIRAYDEYKGECIALMVRDTRSSYVKTIWVAGETVITASNMNKIENELERLNIEGINNKFEKDWGTISLPDSPPIPNGGFPSGFESNYIKYSNLYWIAFSNTVDFSSVKVKCVSNKITSNIKVTYKYSTTNGNSWSEYTDFIELTINKGIEGIDNATVDIHDSDLTTVLRDKDVYGDGVVGNPVEVNMVNGTTSALNEYVGINAQIVVDTEKKQLRIMDGVTKGGTVVSGGSWIGAKSVLDFGAQPLTDTGGQPSSSAFDNTSAIQQAIEWSNANRATVYFPRGRYVIKGTLYLKEFCSFKGDNQLPLGYEPYGNWNKNDVVFLCGANRVFMGNGATETSSSLHQTEIALNGISFQVLDPSDTNMLNTVFFHKLQLNRSDIRHCLFRGFGIWLMGAMFMKTYIERNIFLEMRKYFIQSLSIPNIGNTASIIDSKVINNYISGSQSGSVDNIGFYIDYPAFSEIRGNFIDFWKWGMDIWQGEATSVSDNEFQYCAKGIRVGGANSLNIHGNRFGKMKYYEHKSGFNADVSRWGTVWHGVDLEDSLKGCAVTNNIGSTIDTLIRMRGTTYERMFINANMSYEGTIVDTSISNDTTKKIFIQEFK